jgi:uncharacterized membrane-anchored protein YitT (DUF2179 family)
MTLEEQLLDRSMMEDAQAQPGRRPYAGAIAVLRAYALLTVGALMLALANDIFLIPNDVFSGGATGLGLVINSLTGLPVGVLVLLINVPLVAAGIVWLGGWRFLARTSYAVLVYSLALDLLRPYVMPITSNLLLNTLYGGLLGGAGVGLVFRAQGTTGGDDIGAQLLNKFRGIPVNGALVIINAAILVLAALRFGPEKALYALITAFASSKAVDFVQEGFRPTRLVYIITSKAEEIAGRIQSATGRGVTFLEGHGGYTGKEYRVILTAIRQQELSVVTGFVREADPNAFIIVNEAREVLGQGFKPIPSPQPSVSLPRVIRVPRARLKRRP